MNTYRRQRMSEAMKRTAESNRCPVCGRGAALKMIQGSDGRHHLICRWVALGKCAREQ